MRQFIILVLISIIFVFGCTNTTVTSKTDRLDYHGIYTVDSTYIESTFDKIRLRNLIQKNSDFFEVDTPFDKADGSQGYFLGGDYKIIRYKEFKNSQHWLILKTRKYEHFDLKPYRGIFFIITDTTQRSIAKLKLAENSFTILISSSKDSIISKISNDNVVTKKEFIFTCSDIGDKIGKTFCSTLEITSIYRIQSDRIQKVSSDTAIHTQLE